MSDDEIDAPMDQEAHFSQVMEAAMALRELLQDDSFEDESEFRFMATAPMYFSWILDDLLPIFLMAHMPISVGKPRHHIKAMRMLLSILEESNLHARVARDILDSFGIGEADDD